jgi:hypothetical protein
MGRHRHRRYNVEGWSVGGPVYAPKAYNVFNHSEASAWGAAAAFNASGANTTASFGFPTANRPARILAFSLRFEF